MKERAALVPEEIEFNYMESLRKKIKNLLEHAQSETNLRLYLEWHTDVSI